MSQIGNLPQIGVKIKDIWNHHLVIVCRFESEKDIFLQYQFNGSEMEYWCFWDIWLDLGTHVHAPSY